MKVKTSICVFLIIGLLVLQSLTHAQSQAVVTIQRANLRESQSLKSKVIRTIGRGEEVKIIETGEYGKWFKVTHKGTEGWLHNSTITLMMVNPELKLVHTTTGDRRRPNVTTTKGEQKKADVIFAEAIRLANQGLAESKQASLPKFEEARLIYKEIGNKQFEAYCLGWLGNINNSLGEKRKALEFYNLALPLFRQGGVKKEDSDFYGEVLFGIGKISIDVGVVHFQSGNYDKAIDYFRRAKVSGRGGFLPEIAQNNLGESYRMKGDFRKAIEEFEGLVNFGRVSGKRRDYENNLLLGIAYDSISRIEKPLLFNDKKHGITPVPVYFNRSVPLNNLGLAYFAVGDFSKSVGNFKKAIQYGNQVMRDGYGRPYLGAKFNLEIIYNNLGVVYKSLGQYDIALIIFEQNLKRARQSKNWKNEALALSNIGSINEAREKSTEALEYFAQARTILRKNNEKRHEAVVLNNLGSVYLSLNRTDKAIHFFKKSLKLKQKVGDVLGEADTLNNLAGAYYKLNKFNRAILHYEKSLTIKQRVQNTLGVAGVFHNLMLVYQAQESLPTAAIYGKQAINILQGLRNNINNFDKKSKKNFLDVNETTYRYLADILIAQGRIAEAEQVLAMLKEEEYLSYLRRDGAVAANLKGRISLSPAEKKAFEDYEKFSGEITRSAQEFGTLEKKKNGLPLGETLSAEDQKQYDRLKAKYDAAVTVFSKYLDDLKVKFSENDKRIAVVESDTQGLLKKLNQPQTVIISTIVGEDRLNLIVTTSDIQKAHTVEVKAADLNKLVAEFRDAVKNPNVDPRPLGKKLYDKLFPAALVKDLENIKANTIVWSLDGTLRYVPMAALWDGKKYLVERYRNAVLTLASRDKLDASANADRQKWLAFGVGVSKPFGNFEALPAVPQELCSVVNDPKKKEFCNKFGEKGVFDGLMLRDEEFTLDRFQNNLGKTAIVHIASHFSLNAGNETDSYLLLGGGTQRRFSLDSLKKTRLDNIELLTLSACNTAMSSGSNSTGVEIEGFGALAQKQGAKTVLATLWAVADDSTGKLMTEFYRILEANPKTGKAEAIRMAQLKFIQGKYKTMDEAKTKRSDEITPDGESSNQPKFTKDKNEPFAHPYYWSPFVLIGNWK